MKKAIAILIIVVCVAIMVGVLVFDIKADMQVWGSDMPWWLKWKLVTR